MASDAPDIIFILIDDMGWMDLSCQGSSFYETPHIDALARQGMRFTDAYASCPVCSPTRASVLTGKYPATVGITNFIAGHNCGKLMCPPYLRELPEGETTVAAALHQHGYRTWHVGKWHLGGEGHAPTDFGFDVNVAGCDWGMPKKGYFAPWEIPGYDREGSEGQYLTDHLTDRAVELIDDCGEQPYFLHFSHYAVHTPIQAPEHLVAKYRAKAERLGLDPKPLDEGEVMPFIHQGERRVKRRRYQSDPTYAAMVENLDTNIGRLMQAVARRGRADNTLVVFTSDNGGLSTAEGSPTCNTPLSQGKGWMYEGGTREPTLVCWPKVVAAGSTCDEPITSTDYFPTFLEAAGAPAMPEQHCDGVSIMPLLTGGERLEREAIYWHYPHYANQGGTPGSSIRAGDWKLIEFFEDGKLELYNLRDDIGEAHDLAAEQPDKVRELHAKLVAWRESVVAKIPPENPRYEEMLAGAVPVPSPWEDPGEVA